MDESAFVAGWMAARDYYAILEDKPDRAAALCAALEAARRHGESVRFLASVAAQFRTTTGNG